MRREPPGWIGRDAGYGLAALCATGIFKMDDQNHIPTVNTIVTDKASNSRQSFNRENGARKSGKGSSIEKDERQFKRRIMYDKTIYTQYLADPRGSCVTDFARISPGQW
jgi:hypothetical protein